MQEVDINIVCPEPLQALLQAVSERSSRIGMVGWRRQFFGGNDDLITGDTVESFADNGFGAVRLRRINQVDAQLQRVAHYGDRFLLALACRCAQAAVPPAAQASNTDLQAATSESGVFHACVS